MHTRLKSWITQQKLLCICCTKTQERSCGKEQGMGRSGSCRSLGLPLPQLPAASASYVAPLLLPLAMPEQWAQKQQYGGVPSQALPWAPTESMFLEMITVTL